MIDKVKDIAEKFLREENLPLNRAVLVGSTGLNKDAGEIAGLAYEVNFSGHLLNPERCARLTEYLGEALLNWYILAKATGLTPDEIVNRFAATWEAKRNLNHPDNQASIKDLLKHLKPTVKQQENTYDK